MILPRKMVEADIPAFIADSDLKALPTGAEQLAIAPELLEALAGQFPFVSRGADANSFPKQD